MFKVDYNPDVLTCIANLSNDEVFTPPNIVNQMLDLLPNDLWSNKEITFLDPFTKSGVFLREIAKRLNVGLEKQIPDQQERINHILKNQIFGIAITELTGLLARRSLYCSKYANGKYSICTMFEEEQGNVLFERVGHTWENDKCIYCGTNKTYDRGDELETYAYQFIHTDKPEEFFNMKFDVIIGNPPYQLSDGGGTGDSAKPIYNLFINQAKKLNPNYMSFIVPSRWMKGGKGLNNFREEMINDTKLKVIHDYENAKECFSGINLDGGVNYFLWDKNHNGQIDYYFHALDKTIAHSKRFLKTNFSETVIRDPRQISFLEKTHEKVKTKFSDIVSTRNPYGFSSDFFNRPKEYGIENIAIKPFANSLKIYGVKGKKGGAKRVFGYIDNSLLINKSSNMSSMYKLFFSKAYMTTSTVPPKLILGKPNDICTETFLQIGPFANKDEALNCLSYIKTKFFRALLFFNRHSLNISKSSFDLIPLLPLNQQYTDEILYKIFNLNDEEISFIENIILPMEEMLDVLGQ